MMILRTLLAALTGACCFAAAAAHDVHSRATYLGNEGVMVQRGDVKILFDAFYADSYGQYALVPDAIRAAMMAGAAPFDGVDAVFVSHIHGDHFTAAPTIAYLRAHEEARLFGSKQVLDAIISAGVSPDDPLIKRVTAFDLAPTDAPRSIEIDGLAVDVVAIPHSGNRPEVQNFAWRVTLDDAATVMHLGDAGPVIADFERHKEYFAARKSNTAFPPYWFFANENGEAILTNVIDADRTIGIHVPARAAGNGDEWRARAGGDLFTDPGETREIPQ